MAPNKKALFWNLHWFLSSPSACLKSGASKNRDWCGFLLLFWSSSKLLLKIILYCKVPCCMNDIFLTNTIFDRRNFQWIFELTNVLTDKFFHQRNFDQRIFYRRIFNWRNFWRTKFLTDQFFDWQIFWRILIFRKIFFTSKFLTIESFRIGVPSILLHTKMPKHFFQTWLVVKKGIYHLSWF